MPGLSLPFIAIPMELSRPMRTIHVLIGPGGRRLDSAKRNLPFVIFRLIRKISTKNVSTFPAKIIYKICLFVILHQ